MSQHPEAQKPTAKTTPSDASPDAGRRRFLVAGLATAPLIMTLSARPAFGQGPEATAYGTSQGTAGSSGFETLSGFGK